MNKELQDTQKIRFKKIFSKGHNFLRNKEIILMLLTIIRGGSRIAPSSKTELFVIMVNGFQPLTIITKCSILEVVVVLDPPLNIVILS